MSSSLFLSIHQAFLSVCVCVHAHVHACAYGVCVYVAVIFLGCSVAFHALGITRPGSPSLAH